MDKSLYALLFSMIFFTNIECTISESFVQSRLEAMKQYAQTELAKALLFTQRSSAAQSVAAKKEFADKAQEAIEELVEISDYLENMTSEVKKIKKFSHLLRHINDGKELVKAYVDNAKAALHELPASVYYKQAD